MSQTDLMQRYVAACDFPGLVDDAAVTDALRRYCAALGITRDIERLGPDWPAQAPLPLWRNVLLTLDDVDKRAFNNASDARAASDAWAARDAWDARAAWDAGDGPALLRFAQWCIYGGGWWSYWDMSWLSITYIGAKQIAKPDVTKWAAPVMDAYIAGAWRLYWTPDTLYWVAKPRVHVESSEGARRLHNANGPAVECDIENLYFWHGVMVPSFVIVRPEWITIQHIANENNAEVRRVMIERYGESRYIVDSGMTPIAHDEVYGTLYESPLKDQWPEARIIRVVNRSPEPDGTFKPYWLAVNGSHYGGDAGRIPRAAVASTWRTKPGGIELAFKDWKSYAPNIET